MGQHVGIGVPVEPLDGAGVYPAQDELAARSKGVHIHSQPRPKIVQVVHSGSFRLSPSCMTPLRTLLISLLGPFVDHHRCSEFKSMVRTALARST